MSDLMATRTSPGTFDSSAAVETAASLVLSALLSPARLERLAAQLSLDPTLPSLLSVLRACTDRLFGELYTVKAFPAASLALMTTQTVYVNTLLVQAANAVDCSFAVRSTIASELANVRAVLSAVPTTHPAWLAPTCNNASTNALLPYGCEEWLSLCDKHASALNNAIAAGKPIISALKFPLGPPI